MPRSVVNEHSALRFESGKAGTGGDALHDAGFAGCHTKRSEGHFSSN